MRSARDRVVSKQHASRGFGRAYAAKVNPEGMQESAHGFGIVNPQTGADDLSERPFIQVYINKGLIEGVGGGKLYTLYRGVSTIFY